MCAGIGMNFQCGFRDRLRGNLPVPDCLVANVVHLVWSHAVVMLCHPHVIFGEKNSPMETNAGTNGRYDKVEESTGDI